MEGRLISDCMTKPDFFDGLFAGYTVFMTDFGAHIFATKSAIGVGDSIPAEIFRISSRNAAWIVEPIFVIGLSGTGGRPGLLPLMLERGI